MGGPLVVEDAEDTECRLKLVGIVSFGNSTYIKK
jgi:hypothetical protein